MTPPPPRRFDLGRLLRFARKELREVLRDRRTLLTLVLMPLLLYPLLAVALRQLFLSGLRPAQPHAILLGFPSEDLELGQAGGRSSHDWFQDVLGFAQEARRRQSRDPEEGVAPLSPPLEAFESDNPEEDLRQGRIHLWLRCRELPGRQHPPPYWEWELVTLEGSPDGAAALRYVRARFTEANLAWYEGQGRGAERPPALTSVREVAAGPKKAAGPLPTLVPLILVLMTMTGAVYPAIDVTAGERERGTLEALMAAPVPRFGLLLAKYLAVLTVALLTALVNLGMMTATLLASGLGPLLFGAAGPGPLMAVKVLGLLLLFAAFFAAVVLAVASFARSFKEAQAYLIPLMLASISPGLAALLPNLSVEGPLAVVPLLNVVLLARDLFDGAATLTAAVVVVGATLLYAALAIAVAARVFGAEAVLYSEGGTWGDLLRRPAAPRDAASPAGALLCLAVLFPALYLLSNGLARPLADGPPLVELSVLAAVNVALFAGLPLAAAGLERVRIGPGFALRLRPWLAWPAALLLGGSLWALVAGLVLLLHRLNPTPTDPDIQARLRERLDALRQLGPVAVVLLAGVLPALVEEWFFRGYLFTALRRVVAPGLTVLLTAVLFGLFHLILPTLLAGEKVLVTTLLGLVLGWVRWRTGSVLPGMLLHALHNAIVWLLALSANAPEGAGEESPLPAAWLGAAAVAAALGALGVWLSGRGRDA